MNDIRPCHQLINQSAGNRVETSESLPEMWTRNVVYFMAENTSRPQT